MVNVFPHPGVPRFEGDGVFEKCLGPSGPVIGGGGLGVLILPGDAQRPEVVRVAFVLMPGGGVADRQAVAHQQAGPVRRDKVVEGRAVAVRDDAVERHPVLARGGEDPEAAWAIAPPAGFIGVQHGCGEHLRMQ